MAHKGGGSQKEPEAEESLEMVKRAAKRAAERPRGGSSQGGIDRPRRLRPMPTRSTSMQWLPMPKIALKDQGPGGARGREAGLGSGGTSVRPGGFGIFRPRGGTREVGKVHSPMQWRFVRKPMSRPSESARRPSRPPTNVRGEADVVVRELVGAAEAKAAKIKEDADSDATDRRSKAETDAEEIRENAYAAAQLRLEAIEAHLPATTRTSASVKWRSPSSMSL